MHVCGSVYGYDSGSDSHGGFAWGGASATAFAGKASNGSEPHPNPITQDFSFTPVSGQRWRWVILDCHPSKLTKRSHAMIAEVEFHEAGTKQGVFMINTGTQEKSLVVSSSGDGTPENPAWQAVDGAVRYQDFKYGYDAVLRADLPDPPVPPHKQGNSTTWNWNGMPASGNGNSLGSKSARATICFPTPAKPHTIPLKVPCFCVPKPRAPFWLGRFCGVRNGFSTHCTLRAQVTTRCG